MAISLVLQQNRSIDADTQRFVVQTTATAGVGMPTEVFVYKTDTGLYSHIASISDLANFPNQPQAGYIFYRSATVTQRFDNLGDAADAATSHKSRLAKLVTLYGQTSAFFIGNDQTTLAG